MIVTTKSETEEGGGGGGGEMGRQQRPLVFQQFSYGPIVCSTVVFHFRKDTFLKSI